MQLHLTLYSAPLSNPTEEHSTCNFLASAATLYNKCMRKDLLETELISILKKAGKKITPTRIKLLVELKKSTKPLYIDQIVEKVEGRDKATIYRNLVAFHKLGIVRQIDLHQSKTYYEWNEREDHHHLICMKCEKIRDFNGCDFEHIEKTALKQAPEFSKITEHSFELFGICKECDKK